LCGTSAIYTTWHEQIKAYIIARLLDPGRQTESQLNSIISFARSLSLVKRHIKLIKSLHQAEDLEGLICYLKVLVKDLTKQLQTSNEHQKADRDIRGD